MVFPPLRHSLVTFRHISREKVLQSHAMNQHTWSLAAVAVQHLDRPLDSILSHLFSKTRLVMVRIPTLDYLFIRGVLDVKPVNVCRKVYRLGANIRSTISPWVWWKVHNQWVVCMTIRRHVDVVMVLSCCWQVRCVDWDGSRRYLWFEAGDYFMAHNEKIAW
jgi:hypothetical protein